MEKIKLQKIRSSRILILEFQGFLISLNFLKSWKHMKAPGLCMYVCICVCELDLFGADVICTM